MKIIRPKFSRAVGLQTRVCTFWINPSRVKKDGVFFKERSRHFSLYGINIFNYSLYIDIITGWE